MKSVKQKQKEGFAKAQADLTDAINKLEKLLQPDKDKELFAGVKANLAAVVQLSEKASRLWVWRNKDQEAGKMLIIHEGLAPRTEDAATTAIFLRSCNRNWPLRTVNHPRHGRFRWK